jgi:4-hydroxy-tetrahydrodipicolinate synthase
LPGCAAIKLEDAPTPPKISQVRALLMRDVPIFGGLGGAQFYYELRRGAAGTMTGFAFTEVLVAIYRHYAEGDVEGARRIYLRYLPLLSYEAQPQIGLALRKELLRRRGAIASAAVRQPAMRLDADAYAELDEVLNDLEPSEGSLREAPHSAL